VVPEAIHPEIDEVESSRVEKLLALGLVVFLLVGGFWIMDRLGSLPPRPDWTGISAAQGLPEAERELRVVEVDYQRGVEAVIQAQQTLDRARAEYEFRREEYRVALERDLASPELAAAHQRAKEAFEKAQGEFEVAETVASTLQARLAGPRETFERLQRAVGEAAKRAEDRYQLAIFALRFGYALPLFGLSVWLWLGLRRRRARHLILATSFMGFAGIQAVGLVGQYGWYVLRDIGPIALSAAGSAVCIAGLVAVRRWATSAKRLATSRLRRSQCPYCGFPLNPGLLAAGQVGGAGGPAWHCPGCGRGLASTCAHCGQAGLAETPYCRHCGQPRG
jgi:hypothetical protein